MSSILILNKDTIREEIEKPNVTFEFSNIQITSKLRISNIENLSALNLLNINVLHEAILEIKDYNKWIKKTIDFNISDIKIHQSLINGTLIIKDCGFKYFEFEEVNVCGNIIEDNFVYGELRNIETVLTLKNQA